LDPSKIKNKEEIEKAEGSLSKGNENEKKNQVDFALWKKSKEKEPFWESPWGDGRPGWHIECSVMCSSIFGDKLDIHAGGCDLKFPHHDNEIAQTEAYYDNDQWINYFFHTGHLTINGLKMAKELKNFKKISDYNKLYSANTFRIFFFSKKWFKPLDFK
jgi:cysteinyl-tRNA synthetase